MLGSYRRSWRMIKMKLMKMMRRKRIKMIITVKMVMTMTRWKTNTWTKTTKINKIQGTLLKLKTVGKTKLTSIKILISKRKKDWIKTLMMLKIMMRMIHQTRILMKVYIIKLWTLFREYGKILIKLMAILNWKDSKV